MRRYASQHMYIYLISVIILFSSLSFAEDGIEFKTENGLTLTIQGFGDADQWKLLVNNKTQFDLAVKTPVGIRAMFVINDKIAIAKREPRAGSQVITLPGENLVIVPAGFSGELPMSDLMVRYQYEGEANSRSNWGTLDTIKSLHGKGNYFLRLSLMSSRLCFLFYHDNKLENIQFKDIPIIVD